MRTCSAPNTKLACAGGTILRLIGSSVTAETSSTSVPEVQQRVGHPLPDEISWAGEGLLDRHADPGLGECAVGHHMALWVEMQRHSLHQPTRAGVKGGAAVHRESVVPQHEVADAPFMRIDEVVAGRGFVDFVEEGRAGKRI